MIPQGWLGDLPTTLAPKEQFDYIIKVAKKIEELGFESGWLFDHFHPIEVQDPGKRSVFECWTTLSALSTETTRLRLGQMVTCNSYRHPMVLAKMAASADVISNGRIELGLGAGWFEQEFIEYGYKFPKASVRIAQLDEAAYIIRKMWSEGKVTFDGKYYKVKDAVSNPKPIQKPHPPIWIGGGGENHTLKTVAKYADRWNLGGVSYEEYKRKMGILKRHCSEVGRNFESITKTLKPWEGFVAGDRDEVLQMAERLKPAGQTREQFIEEMREKSLIGTPDEIISALEKYIELGVTYFIVQFDLTNDREPDFRSYELLAKQVLPKFRDK